MKIVSIIEKVRAKQPLIHHLTNGVVMNFSANGLLAFGGSPVMAMAPEEAVEMAEIADGVLINIGTARKADIEAMVLAGKTANKKGIPVVLDPVGVAATAFRRDAVKRLLHEVEFTAIKGNAGEMACLVEIEWQTKGVESIDAESLEMENIAVKVAQEYNTLAVVTGAVDYISDGSETLQNTSGHYLMTRITGAGCLLGSVITAGLTVDSRLKAVADIVHFYGRAGELSAKKVSEVGVRSGMRGGGTGTFAAYFIDALGV